MTPKFVIGIVVICWFSICETKFARKPTASMPVPIATKAVGATVGFVDPVEKVQYIPPPSMFGNPFSFQGPKRETNGLLGGNINGTEYVDKVMGSARKEMDKMGLDSIKPQDIEFNLTPEDAAPENTCKAGLYESEIKGITSFVRLKEVEMQTEGKTTKLKSAFGFQNITYDAGVEITCPKIGVNLDHGHITVSCGSIVLNQVWKLDHTTKNTALDEFSISIGECKAEVRDLAELTNILQTFINKAIEQLTPVVEKAFNVSFKMAVNLGLQVSRAVLLASIAAG